MNNNTDKVIIALDVNNKQEALRLINELSPPVEFYKVGFELYLSAGNDFIRELKTRNLKLFLDLKLHDIPNTISRAVAVIAKLKPDMITVHALGGAEMLKAAVDAAKDIHPQMKVLGVTVLTSIDQAAIRQIGFGKDIKTLVLELARLAYESGCAGIVCSGSDLPFLRKEFASPFLMVTPGIRLLEEKAADDQKRTITPSLAIKQGADYLVLGRAITNQEHLAAALKQLFEKNH